MTTNRYSPVLEDRGFNPLQAKMYMAMCDRNLERGEGYTKHIWKDFPRLTSIHSPVIVGSFAYTCQELKIKWYKKAHVVMTGGGAETPGDIARDYLSLKFPNRVPKCTTLQYQLCVKEKVDAPLHCDPTHLESAVYLDLQAAYWQIVRTAGWDVDYCPNRWFGVGNTMLDFPFPDQKMARNCLVSVGRSEGFMSLWDGKCDIQYIKKPNHFINMVLWRLVCDVLNGVACDMIEVGAVYVYSDGYILPADHLPYALEVLAEWGLEGRIKHTGKAEVYAPGCYAIGDYQSIPFQRFSRIQQFHKVYDPGKKWLKERFQEFANKARLDWNLNTVQASTRQWLARTGD